MPLPGSLWNRLSNGNKSQLGSIILFYHFSQLPVAGARFCTGGVYRVKLPFLVFLVRADVYRRLGVVETVHTDGGAKGAGKMAAAVAHCHDGGRLTCPDHSPLQAGAGAPQPHTLSTQS